MKQGITERKSDPDARRIGGKIGSQAVSFRPKRSGNLVPDLCNLEIGRKGGKNLFAHLILIVESRRLKNDD